jgi:hypothetical protein
MLSNLKLNFIRRLSIQIRGRGFPFPILQKQAKKQTQLLPPIFIIFIGSYSSQIQVEVEEKYSQSAKKITEKNNPFPSIHLSILELSYLFLF